MADDYIGLSSTAKPSGVSADGTVVVGTAGLTQGLVWTEALGVQPLGGVTVANTLSKTTATGISADGTIITGTATGDLFETDIPSIFDRAFIWTEADGFTDLGHIGANVSYAENISSDGTVVVGSAFDGSGRLRAWQWSDGPGMVSLGEVDAIETSAVAWAASGDGSVIVGTSNAIFENVLGTPLDDMRAFVWTNDLGMRLLPTLDTPRSAAYDVSDDGSVIVGGSQKDYTGSIAVRWVDGELFALSGIDGEPEPSVAYGVSGNGEVIVGLNTNLAATAFRWTEAGGMQSVEDWLRDSGVEIEDRTTLEAYATNEDGSVVVGTTFYGSEMFIARGEGTGASDGGSPGGGGGTPGGGGGTPGGGGGTPGGGGFGLITLTDLNTSLANASWTNSSTVSSLGLLLNGAGSRPLDRRAPVNQNIAWATGDLGRDSQGTTDSALGLGEVGIGHNFGPLQINATLGANATGQSTYLGGHTSIVSTYAKVEAMSQLYATDAGGIWGILTGTALVGQADITRNYMANGGSVSGSDGNSGVSGFGMRARLQWENLFPYVSPYAEGSMSRGCLAGYTETGGGFPAQFNTLCESATEFRIGLDARIPVTDTFSLIGTLEATHRTESAGSNVTGQVTGLGAFSLPGVPYQQTWVRAGIGFEAQFAETTLSLMGNVTTSSPSPDIWVSASARTTF